MRVMNLQHRQAWAEVSAASLCGTCMICPEILLFSRRRHGRNRRDWPYLRAVVIQTIATLYEMSAILPSHQLIMRGISEDQGGGSGVEEAC